MIVSVRSVTIYARRGGIRLTGGLSARHVRFMHGKAFKLAKLPGLCKLDAAGIHTGKPPTFKIIMVLQTGSALNFPFVSRARLPLSGELGRPYRQNNSTGAKNN